MGLKDRLEALRTSRTPIECWDWPGYKSGPGYGYAWYGAGPVRVHRAVYELLVGPIPFGYVLDHLCRNRACCNPAHLEPVTQAENLRRAGVNRRKTHCIRGHPFDEANTIVSKKGDRNCRICTNAGHRRRAHASARNSC